MHTAPNGGIGAVAPRPKKTLKALHWEKVDTPEVTMWASHTPTFEQKEEKYQELSKLVTDFVAGFSTQASESSWDGKRLLGLTTPGVRWLYGHDFLFLERRRNRWNGTARNSLNTSLYLLYRSSRNSLERDFF